MDFIAGALEATLSNPTLSLLILGLITAGITIAVSRRRRTAAGISSTLLNHFLIFSVGVSYLYNFVVHSVFGDATARMIGWAQSPFQLEVAFASLGFAAVGFLAAGKARGLTVKLAALLGPAVFLWGAAAGHLYQIAATGNLAAGNAGVVLYTDILLPVIGLGLLAWHVVARRRATEPRYRRHEADSVASQQAPAAAQA